MRALITGATGTIGRRLAASLGSGATPLRRAARPSAAAAEWDGVHPPSSAPFEGLDAVFHLAGEPVAEGRWTTEKKRRILESRTVGTRAIVEAIGRTTRRPRVLVCASAVGFYGDRGDEALTEAAAPGEGFLSDVCVAWEQEALEAERRFGVRTVTLRIGIVLSPTGGALARLRPIFGAGLGGRLGDGQGWMPWVHVDDVVGLLEHAATTPTLRGAVNAVAPGVVRNAEFTRALGRALRRPALLPVPAMALRVAFGELAEVLLASQRVAPDRALVSGFRFAHPQLDEALADVLHEAKAPVAREAMLAEGAP
ncbi:MAG TPA: TIGR01777 family oxidoreductase [Polyangiaceae bacterium]|nr:TIGR01777 family oxidoreductase [Polyangiaceae bacterium]